MARFYGDVVMTDRTLADLFVTVRLDPSSRRRLSTFSSATTTIPGQICSGTPQLRHHPRHDQPRHDQQYQHRLIPSGCLLCQGLSCRGHRRLRDRATPLQGHQARSHRSRHSCRSPPASPRCPPCGRRRRYHHRYRRSPAGPCPRRIRPLRPRRRAGQSASLLPPRASASRLRACPMEYRQRSTCHHLSARGTCHLHLDPGSLRRRSSHHWRRRHSRLCHRR